MTDYFSLPLMNVYTFNHDTRKLSSKHMRLPASSNTTSPTLVYTPGTSDGLTLELVVVGSGRAVYFLQTPTNETSPQQAAARERAVRKAKRKVQELERMAEQLEQALLGDSSPPADCHDEQLGDRSCSDTSFDPEAEKTFESDKSCGSCGSDGDDSDSKTESAVITWDSEPSMSFASSSESLSCSSSCSSCDAVSLSIMSITSPLPSEFSLFAAEELSEAPVLLLAPPISRSSSIARILDELEASTVSPPADLDTFPPLPFYRASFRTISSIALAESRQQSPDDVARGIPRSTVPSGSTAESANDVEDGESWVTELFGSDSDAPKEADGLRVDTERSVVRPVGKSSRLPEQAERTRVMTLDYLPPITASRCEIFFGNVAFPSTGAPSVPGPPHARSFASSIDKPRRKRKADDDDLQTSMSSSVQRLRKISKVAHTVVVPTTIVSYRGAKPAACRTRLLTTTVKRSLTTPAPLVQSSRPGLTASISSAGRRVPGQKLKRKRHPVDSRSDSEDNIPLARLLRRAKKQRTAVPPRATAFATPAAPAPNAF
ncbi:hypothetical protein OH76DRAFT_1406801 [Lentinus brumalis]|uniref:Uncharacterized protein n=1 Tax=Lentinus brumalis TaxID=2498619 RepID=A0A371D1V1_9APHY|nr:hypothetical protein OH76DRAFT_1406801 [Polyporus brumalis]